MNSACILVGNGTSVTDVQNGSEVDRFETVVRFNKFETAGFEKHVGIRTSIWFCGLPVKPDDWRIRSAEQFIYGHSWNPDANKCSVFKSLAEASPSKVYKVDHRILGKMSEYAGTDYIYWSTGAIGIWLMLERFPCVTITGFDWWDRISQHYFNPKSSRGTLHKPEVEKVLIDRLTESDKVRFL